MSIDQARAFIAKAEQDSGIQKKFEARGLPGTRDEACDFAVQIGGSSGFKFSSQDYSDACAAVITDKMTTGELDEEQLSNVSGGIVVQNLTGDMQNVVRTARPLLRPFSGPIGPRSCVAYSGTFSCSY